MSGASLSNQLYFPVFKDLPTLDEIDANYCGCMLRWSSQCMCGRVSAWIDGNCMHGSLSQLASWVAHPHLSPHTSYLQMLRPSKVGV